MTNSSEAQSQTDDLPSSISPMSTWAAIALAMAIMCLEFLAVVAGIECVNRFVSAHGNWEVVWAFSAYLEFTGLVVLTLTVVATLFATAAWFLFRISAMCDFADMEVEA